MTEHTPWPAKLKTVHHNEKAPDIAYVVPAEHQCEASCCSPTSEYGVFYHDSEWHRAGEMVRRWNAHDELVAALEGFLSRHSVPEVTADPENDPLGECICGNCVRSRAALAKAKGAPDD